MFQIKVVEEIKIHISLSETFFLTSCHLWDNVEKYGGAREAADGNMTALCIFQRLKGHLKSKENSHCLDHKFFQYPSKKVDVFIVIARVNY
jgi:hypothetical protein